MRSWRLLVVALTVAATVTTVVQHCDAAAGIRFAHFGMDDANTPLPKLSLRSANLDEFIAYNISFGTAYPSTGYNELPVGVHDMRLMIWNQASGQDIEIGSTSITVQDQNSYTIFCTGIYKFLMALPDASPSLTEITHTAFLSADAVNAQLLLNGAIPYVPSTAHMYMSFGYYPAVSGQSKWMYMSYWTDYPSGDYNTVPAWNASAIHVVGPLTPAVSGDPNSPDKSFVTTAPLASIAQPSNSTASECVRSSQCGYAYLPDSRLATQSLDSEQYYAEVLSFSNVDVTRDNVAIRGFVTKSQCIQLIPDHRTLTSGGRAVIRFAHLATDLGPLSVYLNSASGTPLIARVDRFQVYESSAIVGTYSVVVTRFGSLQPLNVTGRIEHSFFFGANGEYTISLFRPNQHSLDSRILTGVQGTNGAATASVSVYLLAASFVLAILPFW
ncbi:hypothetical protein CAOG_002078 [Capsaspora owczarzaki ATCC 30864]|uniref:DUF4397 domain-containing protein n=2 Tax=Capsaspora owczarzaki (strain ATCC 30864) TaxID=595528 RepID=A0A0D2U6P2_CAPO3|nr:hypothetical protein CAOG_002078 [Capsaspora owczarzaki ATCC 30864]